MSRTMPAEAQAWLDQIANFLVGKGEVKLATLGSWVPKPDGVSTKLLTLLTNDQRFTVSADRTSVQLTKANPYVPPLPHPVAPKDAATKDSDQIGRPGIRHQTATSAIHQPAKAKAKSDQNTLIPSSVSRKQIAAGASIQPAVAMTKADLHSAVHNPVPELKKQAARTSSNHSTMVVPTTPPAMIPFPVSRKQIAAAASSASGKSDLSPMQLDQSHYVELERNLALQREIASQKAQTAKELADIQLQRQHSQRELAENMQQLHAARVHAEEEYKRYQDELDAARVANQRAEENLRKMEDKVVSFRRASAQQMRIFEETKDTVIQRDGYLSYERLEHLLRRSIGDSRMWGHELKEHCNGLRMMLSSVEGAVDAALATHTIVTLHDVERSIMKNKNFKDFNSFAELSLGSLVHNRKVIDYFGVPYSIRERGRVPEITTAEVLSAIAAEMSPGKRLAKEQGKDKEAQKKAIWETLDELAQRNGYENAAELCVFVKGEAFIVWLMAFASVHARQQEEFLKRELGSARAKAEKQAFKEVFEASLNEFSEEILGQSSHDILRAGRLWRAVQGGVSRMRADKALVIIRQMLLRMPEIWRLLDAMKILQKDPRGVGETASKVKAIERGDPNGAQGGEDEGEGGQDVEREVDSDSDSSSDSSSSSGSSSSGSSSSGSSGGSEENGAHKDSMQNIWQNRSANTNWPSMFCALLKKGPVETSSSQTIAVGIATEGSQQRLRKGDFVVLKEGGINAKDWSTEVKGLRERMKADPNKRQKLKPRAKCISSLLPQRSEEPDMPLRFGEVGVLEEVDASSVPYWVSTPSGSRWWYEKSAIERAPASSARKWTDLSGIDMTQIADSIAPLILCAMKRIPLDSSLGNAVLDFNVEEAATALRQFFASTGMSVGRLDLETLLKAEEVFASTSTAAQDFPSFLQFMHSRPEFREMFEAQAARTQLGDEEDMVCGVAIEAARIIDTIRSSFTESLEGRQIDLLAVLAGTEQLVCEVYGVPSFSRLQRGTTFLQFCRLHGGPLSQMLDKLRIANDEHDRAPSLANYYRGRLLEIAYLASRPDKADSDHAMHIMRAVERHFGLDIAALGFASADDVLTELKTWDKPSSATDLVPAAHALLWHGNKDHQASKEVKADEAMDELKSAPYLVDLAEWSGWDARFLCDLGPLRAFAERVWRSHGRSGGWRLLEIRHDLVVKIPAVATIGNFEDALHRYDPLRAAAACVALAADGGSVAALQDRLQLLRRKVEESLTRTAPLHAAAFAFAAAASLPSPLRVELGLPLFVEPLLQHVPDAEIAVARLCHTPADRAALRQIGLACGRRRWTAAADARAPAEMDMGGKSWHPEEEDDELEQENVHSGPADGSESASHAPNVGPVAQPLESLGGVAPVWRRQGEGGAEGMSDVQSGGSIHPDTLAICRRIRVAFGLEVGCTPPTQAAQDVVNNAIQRLAADLYAKEVHFVLELIQNCDDNAYPEGVEPSLSIEIGADQLIFCNNEVGFTEENIVALSNIGKSTKAAKAGYIGQKGIGFKSVFKVAQRPQVHSRTFHFEFDSDGAATDGFSYIIPRPQPTPAGWDESGGTTIVLPFKRGNTGDSQGRNKSVEDMVRKNVYDIDRSLLLFLNRIRRIHVTDVSRPGSRRRRRNVRAMCRREEPGGVICIEERNDSMDTVVTERWLITSRLLQPEVRRTEQSQQGELTRLSIAIPLLPPAQLGHGMPPPQPRDVFAFLPLRSYGFRWVLQGDFVLPSAREAVDASNPWNQRLLIEVPSLFVEAALALVARAQEASAHRRRSQIQSSDPGSGAEPAAIQSMLESRDRRLLSSETAAQQDSGSDSDDVQGQNVSSGVSGGDEDDEERYLLKLLFTMVPLPGQTNEFFAGVPREILALLRDTPIIPVESGGFATPHESVRAPALAAADSPEAAEAERLLEYTGHVLARMGLRFVRRDVEAPEQLLHELGVRPLSDLLCGVLACAVTGWERLATLNSTAVTTATGEPETEKSLLAVAEAQLATEKAPPPPPFSSEWVVHMLAALEATAEVGARLDDLRRLAIFPLSSHSGNATTLMRQSDGDIYEVEDVSCAEELADIAAAGASAPGSGFANLRVICPNFHALLVANQPARVLARRIGLRSTGSEPFILRHLIPAMAARDATPAALVLMLCLAKRLARAIPALQGGRLEAEMRRAGAQIVDGAGRVVPVGTPLHFPPCYGVAPAVRAADILPPRASPEAASAATSSGHVGSDGYLGSAASTEMMLVDPDFDERWPTVSPAYAARDGDTAGWSAWLRGLGVVPFAHVDGMPPHASRDFDVLLSGVAEEPAGALVPKAEVERLRRIAQALSTVWAAEYADVAAAAAAGGGDNSFLRQLRRRRWVPSEAGLLYAPVELFHPAAAEARRVLGPRAAFAAANGLRGPAGEALGLQQELSPGHVVDALRGWAKQPSQPVPSLGFLVGVYAYLAERLASPSTAADSLSATLRSFPCVFVPDRSQAVAGHNKPKKSDKDCYGHVLMPLQADTPIEGTWRRPCDCVWYDPTYLIDSLLASKQSHTLSIADGEHRLASSVAGCRALKDYYDRLCSGLLEQFFCAADGRGLAVRKQPSDQDYLDIWQAVGEMRPVTPYSVATALRIAVHFLHEHQNRNRNESSDDEEDGDDRAQGHTDSPDDNSADAGGTGTVVDSLLKAIRVRAARLYVPNAGGKTLSPLSLLAWIADPVEDLQEVQGEGFDGKLLDHCAPLIHEGLHGIEDASKSKAKGAWIGGGKDQLDRVLIGKLNQHMQSFYGKMLSLPRLRDCLSLRTIGCEPDARSLTALAGGPSRTAAAFAILHVASRALQAWAESAPLSHVRLVWGSRVSIRAADERATTNSGLKDLEAEAAARRARADALKSSVSSLRVLLVPPPGRVSVLRRWVAEPPPAAGGRGAGLRFESALERTEASCGMDVDGLAGDGPVLVGSAPGPGSWVAEDLAAALARLVPGGTTEEAAALQYLRPHLASASAAVAASGDDDLTMEDIDKIFPCPPDPWLPIEPLAQARALSDTSQPASSPPDESSQTRPPPGAADLLSDEDFQRRLREGAAEDADLARQISRAAAANRGGAKAGDSADGGAIRVAIENQRALRQAKAASGEVVAPQARTVPSTTYALGPPVDEPHALGIPPPPRLFEDGEASRAHDSAAAQLPQHVQLRNGADAEEDEAAFADAAREACEDDEPGAASIPRQGIASNLGQGGAANGGGRGGELAGFGRTPLHLRLKAAESFTYSGRERTGWVPGGRTGEFASNEAATAADGVWVTEEELLAATQDMSASDAVAALPQGGLWEDVAGIGRWGEELVYRLLKDAAAKGATGPADCPQQPAEVVWVNEESETGLPFDIVIRRRRRQDDRSALAGDDPSGQEGEEDSAHEGYVEDYVEVKSTRLSVADGALQQPFPFSVNQLLFALKKGPQMQVYRVFGALSGASAQVLAIPDVTSRLLSPDTKVLCDLAIPTPPDA